MEVWLWARLLRDPGLVRLQFVPSGVSGRLVADGRSRRLQGHAVIEVVIAEA